MDGIEEKESQEKIEELEDELDQIKSIVMDFRWIFNDFDDLSQLKLLSEQEYQDLKSGDGGELQEMFESLDERLARILEETSGDKVDRLEERIDRLEEKTEEDVQEDLEVIVDKIEDQDSQMEEIREGYVELGEMMQILLEEYRNSTVSN
jgi:hypothetical protein